jgi:hypothetical protein
MESCLYEAGESTSVCNVLATVHRDMQGGSITQYSICAQVSTDSDQVVGGQ